MTKLKDKDMMIKSVKIACLLFLMFSFSSYALAHEADIAITGSDAPVDGACYTAAGGHEPYAWSISKGSMDSNGCVSGISDQCGTATITVTDSCGYIGTVDVRLPGGHWVCDEVEYSPGGYYTCSNLGWSGVDDNQFSCGSTIYPRYCKFCEYVGEYRYDYTTTCTTPSLYQPPSCIPEDSYCPTGALRNFLSVRYKKSCD